MTNFELPSGRIKNIIGQKFGEYTVLEFSHLDKFQNSVWKVKCSCGSIKYLSVAWLKSPSIGSCGCKKNKKISIRKTQDLTGHRFGRLVAIRKLKQHFNGNYIWEFNCDCGNVVEVKAGDVKSGNTLSCGCLKKDSTISRNILFKRKPNNASNKNTLFNHYRNHAKNRRLTFSLTKDEFIILAESACFYCGETPQRGFRANKHSGEWQSGGIDRIDSAKGYSIDNVVPCCKQCNIMKLNYTQEQFYRKVEQIYNNLKLETSTKNEDLK